MSLVLDFLVSEADLGEVSQPAAPAMQNTDLAMLAAALLQEPHPALLHSLPPEVDPHLRDDLWTDFFAVL